MPQCFAYILLLFSPSLGSFNQAGQGVALLVLFIASLGRLLGQKEWLEVRNAKFTAGHFLLVVVLPTQAMILVIGSNNLAIMGYAGALVLGTISALFLERGYTIEDCIQSFLFACLGFGIISIIWYFDEFYSSLLGLSDQYGRRRFAPFGNHPNLIGHTFGAAFILQSCAALFTWFKLTVSQKYTALAILLLFGTILFASNSRGTMAAVFISAMVLLVFFQRKRFILVIPIVLTGAMVIVLFVLNNEFLSDSLEVNSDSRGVNSGLTGRTDNWPIILSHSIESLPSIIFGNGYRTWDSALHDGVDTDNSYVNLIWEFGFFQALMVPLVILAAIRSYLSVNRHHDSRANYAAASVLVFSLISSIFARYLYAVGNPASIILLISIFHAGRRL